MKKAFTLIELLVVIAIIAILAAILFPVFAQAKMAAKKAATISNQKQISLGIMMYSGDYDDIYPRNDECVQGSALNPKFKAASYNSTSDPKFGCGVPPNSYNRVNHYTWQKWVLPYIKSTDLFFHPVRQKDAVQWDTNGQIFGSFSLNIALTGQIDTLSNGITGTRAIRNSFLGGSQTAIPNVSAAMLLFDTSLGVRNPETLTYNFAPGLYKSSEASNSTITLYPMAVREYWTSQLMKPGSAACTYTTTPDERRTTTGGLVIGFADGSAKWLPVGKFLANTPTNSEYLAMNSTQMCGNLGSSSAVQAAADPNLNLNYPMWGLGQ
jgi:prepilin-type N-terminal cleavage/methylation domain-containing protein